MKPIITAFCLFAMTSTTFAGDMDGSISLENATKVAFSYSMDNVFGEILDESSSVIANLASQDVNAFTFVVSARTLPQVCLVKVKVSKETGMAFNDDAMMCGIIKATAK